jgi:alpha-N-arabinofuranosidase
MSLKSTASLLVLVATLVATAQTPVSSAPVAATIDTSRTGAPISPYVYGQFLEHASHLVYGSL